MYFYPLKQVMCVHIKVVRDFRLRIGLTIVDLKELTYIDVMKILLSFIGSNNQSTQKSATQSDIDKLLG